MAALHQDINILVIEDNPGDYVLIQEHLHEETDSPSIDHAKTFSEAQKYLNDSSPFDAILLDLTLPDASGEELVKDIVNLSDQSPVIVLTGYENKQFGLKTLGMGIADYLLKDELSPFLLYKSISYSIERNRINQSLRESEKQYRNLFDLSPLPKWVYDAETLKFLDVNQFAIDHYGYSRDEFLSMTIKDIRPSEEIPKLEKSLERCLKKTGLHESGIHIHQKKDGTRIQVDIRSNLIEYDGQKAKMVVANDITDRLETEEQLALREKRFKSLVQDGSDLIAILDGDANYKYVAPTFEAILGISADKFIGNNALSYIHEDDQERIQNILATLEEEERVEIAPFRFRDGDGNWRWIESTITNMIDNPAVEGFVANSRDVTDRIERKQKLQESLRRYDIVSKATNDVIWDWDLNTNEVLWNDALTSVLGYDQLETDADWWYEHIHPDDREAVMEGIHAHIDQGQEKWAGEYRFRCADGSYKVFYDRGFLLFDEDGEPNQMIGSMQDITERKQYEEQLEELSLVASKTTDVIIMTDPNERITWVNQAFEELTGYTAEESIGKNPGSLLQGPETDSDTVKRLAEAVRDQHSIQEVILNYSKTGESYWLDITIDPIFDDEGNCEGFIAIEKDVTEQIERQRELREHVDRYESVSKATSDTIWDLDIEDDTILYNQNIYSMFGYEKREVDEVGDWWRNKIHPSDRSRVLEIVDNALSSSSDRFQMEYRFQAADGSYKHIFDRAFIVENEEGDPIRVIGAMQDVTKQREEQKWLQLFESAIATTTESVAILEATPSSSKDGRKIKYVNKAFCKMTGYEKEEAIGHTLFMLKGSKTEENEVRKLVQSMNNWEACEAEIVNYRKDGEPFWVHISMAPVKNDDDSYSHWVCVGRDVTDRREREKELMEINRKNRLTLESTAEGIYGIDTEGKCTFINEAAANLLGYHSEECIGENMHELIHHKYGNGEHYPESKCPIFVSKNNHESCRVTDEVFWRADGSYFDVEYTSNPMIEDGDIKGAVVAFSDITERKQRERTLKKSLEEKETLLLEIHHRVKNNLAVVSGMMQLQAFEEEDEYLRDKLFASVARIQTMGSIHELLYQSKSFSQLEFDENIKRLVSDIIQTLQTEVNIDVTFDIASINLNINQAIPCSLIINEVITNIIKHAFPDYSEGKILIKVEEQDNQIALSIKDNGQGLPAEFDHKSSKGTLGMNLIDTLAAQLEADYNYQSIPNGAEFNITFEKVEVKGIGNAFL